MVSRIALGSIQVGTKIPPLTKCPTAEQCMMWAEMTGDANPIHCDKDFALSVGLPGIIVPGQLVMAFLGQMVTDWLGEGGELGKLSVNYKGYIFFTEAITCHGVVVERGTGRAVIRVWAENPQGKKTVTGTAIVKVRD